MNYFHSYVCMKKIWWRANFFISVKIGVNSKTVRYLAVTPTRSLTNLFLNFKVLIFYHPYSINTFSKNLPFSLSLSCSLKSNQRLTLIFIASIGRHGHIKMPSWKKVFQTLSNILWWHWEDFDKCNKMYWPTRST